MTLMATPLNKTEDTDTVALPVNGRKTLQEQGKSLAEVIDVDPKIDDTPLATKAASKAVPVAKVPEDPGPSLPRRPREDVLDDASEQISVERDAEYGDALQSFTRIAALWTARDMFIGNRVYTALDVAAMMRLVKESRLAFNPNHRASQVGIVGYGALAAELSEEIN